MCGLLFRLFCSPGVEECAIEQSTIVVVAYIVRDLHGSDTLLWKVVSLNLHLVFCVPDIKQKHIKVQDGIRGDDVTWGGSSQTVMLILVRQISKNLSECTLSQTPSLLRSYTQALLHLPSFQLTSGNSNVTVNVVLTIL